ncbi:MAG: hypothetical protein J0M11_14885 [Anaerolineae bacterium]|nr:hypothetical protein [Anaerolineae bacterium]
MKRTLPVTLTLSLVLILTSWNALRAWTSIVWRDVLTEFGATLPPNISAAIGILWFIIGDILVWSIWKKKAWSAKMLLGVAAGYSVWYWSERLFWQNPRPNTIFAVFVQLACFTLIYITLKSLSREAYERNSENPATE